MPAHKVEDLFTGDHIMLLELVNSLHRKGRHHQAKGVYMRHNLHANAPSKMQDLMAEIKYD